MRHVITAVSILGLLALTAGCDSEPSAIADELRGLDVNIQLIQADGGEEDGTILWEIVEAEVFDGPAIAGDLSLYLEGDQIYTAMGEQTCVVSSPQLNSTVREVIAANGTEVLFSIWGDYVFEGPIDPSITNLGRLEKLHGDQLLFEFKASTVYLGKARYQSPLVEANADLEASSNARKLLIAALITGECGATGMPGF